MTVANNPAGRLHALLAEAQGAPNHHALIHVWARVLNVSADNVSDVLAGLGEVVKLPQQVVTQIKPLLQPGEEAHFMAWRAPVELIFSQFDLRTEWRQIAPHLNQNVMSTLWFCHRELDKHASEPALKQETVAEILQDIRDLTDEVNVADLDADLKLFVLQHLAEIAAALSAVKVHGSKPVRTATMTAVIDVVATPAVTKRLRVALPGRKFFAIIRRLVLLTSLAKAGLELAGAYQELLSEGDANTTEVVPHDDSPVVEPGTAV